MVVAAVAIWISTTIWVGLDSLRREWPTLVRADGSRVTLLDRSWRWMLATLLCWPVIFPTYLYRRVHAPVKVPAAGLAPLRRLVSRSSGPSDA
jgi:hypothetical protein